MFRENCQFNFLPTAFRRRGEVMFLHLLISLSTGGGGWGRAPYSVGGVLNRRDSPCSEAPYSCGRAGVLYRGVSYTVDWGGGGGEGFEGQGALQWGSIQWGVLFSGGGARVLYRWGVPHHWVVGGGGGAGPGCCTKVVEAGSLCRDPCLGGSLCSEAPYSCGRAGVLSRGVSHTVDGGGGRGLRAKVLHRLCRSRTVTPQLIRLLWSRRRIDLF